MPDQWVQLQDLKSYWIMPIASNLTTSVLRVVVIGCARFLSLIGDNGTLMEDDTVDKIDALNHSIKTSLNVEC